MRIRTMPAAGIAAAVLIAGAVTWALTRGTTPPAPPGPVVVASALDIAGRGATVPFIEHEAESATFTGELLGPDRTAKSLAGEASGRHAVRLDSDGQHVEFTLTEPANAMVMRYSVPDGPDGAGADFTLSVHVDGTDVLDLPVTSRYGWFYGGFPFTNDPADGSAHHFYDHVRTRFDRELPAGTTVRLSKDADDTAEWYVVDLVDFELVPEPSAAPPGSLSVLDFGADPTGVSDSAAAITDAIAAAHEQRREVWLPPGSYLVNQHLIVDDVTIRGAGPWHSILRGNGVGVYGNYAPRPSHNVGLYDFAILGEVTERDDDAQVNGVGGALGGGSVVQNLWIQHTKVGMWLDGPFDGLTVRGNRILDTTADGLNLHRGISNTVVEDNFVRNTGDDGLAMWADEFPNHHNEIRFNTVLLPMLANGIAVYGGHDNTVSDNVIADTLIEGGGIQVANRFSGTVFLDGVTTVARNTVLRGGSLFPFLQTSLGAIVIYAKDAPIAAEIRLIDNELLDSSYAGLQFLASTITGVRVEGLLVDGAGTFGIQAQATGAASIDRVVVRNSGHAGLYTCPDALPFSLDGAGTGLDTTFCGPFPEPVYRFTP